MPEKPKVHFQVKCDNLPLCGFEGRCSASNDWYMVDCSDCLDKNLTYLKWKREGAKAERERIHQDIAEMQNPYPKDVFISEKYDSWRQAWDICHKKVMELI